MTVTDPSANHSKPDSPKRPVSGRRQSAALVALGVAVIAAGVVWVGSREPERPDGSNRVRLDAIEAPDRVTTGRASRNVEPPTQPVLPSTELALPTTIPGRLPTAAATRTRSGTGSSTGRYEGNGGFLGTATIPHGLNPDRSSPGGSPGPGDTSWLPGPDVEAPITGPVTNLPGDTDSELPTPPTTAPESARTPDPEEVDPPDPDEIGCPNLGLVPIGGYEDAASSAYAHLHTIFRSLAPSIRVGNDLVCGHPLESWRDLTIQRLMAGGKSAGVIITAADGTSVAMHITDTEWNTYRFRYNGDAIGVNLVGYPVGRIQLNGVDIIRTTAGGLVFGQPGGLGLPVLGGQWDFWIAAGGPAGSMGLPMGVPESAAGPTGATSWAPGMASTGARQTFQHGWTFLAGVISDVDALSQPADRYRWFPWSELPVDPKPAVDYRGHIMKLGPTTWYVDKDGIRHWIPSASAWMCATWDLKATQYVVEAWELDAYPEDSHFVCADYK